MSTERAIGERLATVLRRLHGEAVLQDWARPFLLQPTFDSMAMLTLLVEIENEFEVSFAPDELFRAFDSPGSLQEYLVAKLGVGPERE
jgi:acyl carrier protein